MHNFLFCFEHNIAVNCDAMLARRIARYFEESLSDKNNETNKTCVVCFEKTGQLAVVKRDRKYRYSEIKMTSLGTATKLDFYRYGKLIRTVLRRSKLRFEIQSYLEFDEEAILICFRQYLHEIGFFSTFPLIHASLVMVEGKGLLLCGPSGSGKTALIVRLISEFGATFVNDDYVCIDLNVGQLVGYYVPRRVTPRFCSVLNTGLSAALDDLRLSGAEQYLDDEAIQEMKDNSNFNNQFGLCYSRYAFSELLGCNAKFSCTINYIIHIDPFCLGEDLEEVNSVESLRMLSNAQFSKRRFGSRYEFEKTGTDFSRISRLPHSIKSFKVGKDWDDRLEQLVESI